MTVRRPRAVVLGAALLATAVAGCTGADAGGDGHQTVVGVAMPTTTSQRWIADGENVATQLERLGHDVDLRYAEDDVALQVQQVGEMVDAGVDALVIGSVDGSALAEVLDRAGAADIPVVAYDRLIRDSGHVAYYATFDNWRVGVQQGTALLQGLGVLDAAGEPTGAEGPFQIEIFAGSPDDNNARFFYDGAMSILEPYLADGVLVVPSGLTGFEETATPGWNAEDGAERLRALMPAYEDGRLDGLLAPFDGISRAFVEVVREHGYGTAAQPWPVITGQDAEVDSVKLVRDGEQHSTIYKDTRQLAEVAVAMVDALLNDAEPETNDLTTYDNGVRVVPSYLLIPQLVTADNYEAVVVESGYYTTEDLS